MPSLPVTFEFIGSAGGNPSAALTGASQVNHDGHSGYRIDQIAGDLSGADGTGGNNGGGWFNRRCSLTSSCCTSSSARAVFPDRNSSRHS
jgi:hypothetical protein